MIRGSQGGRKYVSLMVGKGKEYQEKSGKLKFSGGK